MNAPRRFLVMVATLLAVALLLAGCGSLTSYAAKVNGSTISQNELDRELNAVLNNKAYLDQIDQGFSRQAEEARGAGEDTLNSVFVARLLERRIAFEIVHQEVERRKLEVQPEDLENARKEILESVGNDERVLNAFPSNYRDELLRATAEVSVLERALTEGPKDDAALRDYYEQNLASFQTICLRGILVNDKAQADSVRSRVSGGADFAAIARAESRDNQGPGGGSAARGGDLGCAPANALGDFERQVSGLQPGQVSEPVQTPSGFVLFQLVERRTKPFEEAAPEVRQRIEQQASEGVRNFVAEQFQKAKISVNPRYGEFVQSPTEVGVKAPSELTPTTLAPVPGQP
jgi:parvulin-like peptidyl-prolyl isomerase